MGRFSVKIGTSFEIDEVKVEEGEDVARISEAAVSVADASGRGLVLKTMVTLLMSFLYGSALYGLIIGSFDPLTNVWMASAPFVGGIVGYYFRLNKEAG